MIKQNEAISKKVETWNRTEKLLEYNEEEIKCFCIQLPNEASKSYRKRKDEFFSKTFINLTHDLLSAPINSIFQNGYKATHEDENNILKEFTDKVTLSNDKIGLPEFVRDYVGLNIRAYGAIATVIEKPRYEAKHRGDERKFGIPYVFNIRLQDILDWEIVGGELLWIAYSGKYTPEWTNPLEEKPETKVVEYILTRDKMVVRDGENKIIDALSYEHNFGFVPIVIQSSFLTDPKRLFGSAAFDQTGNTIVTFNNLLNIGVYELMKHGGSLLLRHEDSVVGQARAIDPEGDTLMKTQDNNTTLEWGGEHKPEYLLKDLAVDKIKDWAMLYFEQAIENERDLKSVVKKGTDGQTIQESGFAKALDRQPIEANLTALANDCESYVNKLTDMAAKMLKTVNDYTFEFDTEFDMKFLSQKLDELKKMLDAGLNKISPMMVKEHTKNIIPDITQDQDKQKEIEDEIDSSDDSMMSFLSDDYETAVPSEDLE